MADVKISALPAATTPLAGTEVLPIVQGGATDKVSVANLTAGRTVAAAGLTVDANSSGAAVRITQTGAGNALLVEDSASTDSTPFVIDQSGKVVVGNTTALNTVTFAGAALTPIVQTQGVGMPLSAIGITNWANSNISPASIVLSKSKSNTVGTPGVVASGDFIGAISFTGDDGTSFVNAAAITASVDATPGTSDMPGRLVFSTTADGASTPTERMRIDSAGNVSIGGSAAAGQTLRVNKNITGATFATGIISAGNIQSDVTSRAALFQTSVGTAAASFTLSQLYHAFADQGTFGAGSIVSNQHGYAASSTLVGATNNYGFSSNINAGTTRTITNVERTSNVVTITTSVAHGYTAGQSVTVAATTNTGVNGTFTIASVPTTSTFTYAQTAADIPSGADTGSTVVVGRWNFYASGTAPNFFAGNVGIGVVPTAPLHVAGSAIITQQITGGYNDNGTNTAAQALGTYRVVKNTISADTTFTTTVAAAGATASVIIVSSGTSSRTVTFGTGFKTTGTLATGTTSGVTFVVRFVSDGTNMIETSRTTAMT